MGDTIRRHDETDEPDVPFTSLREAMQSLRTLARAAANNHERNLAKYMLRHINGLTRENKKLRHDLAEARDLVRVSRMNARALIEQRRQ